MHIVHQKFILYDDDSFQSQSSTGDFTGFQGRSGGNVCWGGEPDTVEFQLSFMLLHL